MSEPLDLPLHLFQVLEEEHISLYGRLDDETIINLRGNRVTSRLDWRFHPGHIKDWEEFKHNLQNPDTNLPNKLKELVASEKVANWENQEQALSSFNRLLEKCFYDRRSCGHVNLSKTTAKLLELYPWNDMSQMSDVERARLISPEELRRLNRFLLEDLFPKYLGKVSDIRLAAIYQRRHDQRSAALCFSGGGIRSGTFGLGLLQGLARHGLLNKFDYLSTVSGGGYIGGWLTAWIHRHRRPQRGLPGVSGDLANSEPGSKIDPDPPAVQHLREYSNFLTPKVGLMSGDTWTFLAIYVRNLLLNWSVIIPLLLAFLLIPRLSLAAIIAKPTRIIDSFSLFGYAFNVYLRHIFLVVGFFSVSWAIAYMVFSRPGLRTRLIERSPSWKDRMGQRGFLKYCLVPLVTAATLLTTYWAWTPHEKSWWQFLLFGLAAALFGLFGSTIVLGRWRRTRRRNWRESVVVAPILLLVAGTIGGLLARAMTTLGSTDLTVVKVDESWATELYVSYAVPLFLLMFMLAATVFAGISSNLGKVNDEDREWWARFSAWTLISALVWAVFSSLVIFGPIALLAFPKLVGAVGGASGIVALLLGRSAKTPATSEQVSQGGWKAQLSSYLLPLLAVLFLAVFVAALSLMTSKLTRPMSIAVDAIVSAANPWLQRVDVVLPHATWVNQLDQPFGKSLPVGEPAGLPVEISHIKVGDLFPVGSSPVAAKEQGIPPDVEHMRSIHYPRWWFFLLFLIMLFVIGLLLARLINLNLFSLHASYRNRLIRGFLAASREKPLRRPNPFTGFDAADNVFMHELRPALLHEVDFEDLEGFAGELKKAGDSLRKGSASSPTDENQSSPASEFIYTQLSEKGKAAADGYDPPAPLSQRHQVDLIEDLNRILEDEQIHLWQVSSFQSQPQQPGAQQPSVEDRASPPREYHIHRNRRALEQTYPKYIARSNYPPHRLLHVVNTTLNLVGGDNLAWQQRKAQPFTVSPLHCGSYRVGYRRSKDYGGDDGISLGTALAISGAAASSNMGYYTTSPVLSLVLTLFNVRLGWWLGNPGPAGSRSYRGLETNDLSGTASKKIYRRMSPTLSILPVLYEALGLTDDQSDYVYLTDGGHFENLALYEMVLRRCHLIVVSDGAADSKYEFNDLGNAIRKIRIDLGIPIEFPDVPIYRRRPEKEGEGGCYWAIGRIRYSAIDYLSNGQRAKDGIVIYIKPAVYEDEPEDVVHYKRTHPTFPHETTADQFFDEPQFESYRALGSYIMDRMTLPPSDKPDGLKTFERDIQDLNLDEFFNNAKSNLESMAPQMKDKYVGYWNDLPAERP